MQDTPKPNSSGVVITSKKIVKERAQMPTRNAAALEFLVKKLDKGEDATAKTPVPRCRYPYSAGASMRIPL